MQTHLRMVWKKGYSQQLKRSLGYRGRRFNLGSQTRFWICATGNGSWNNRSAQALKQHLSTEKWTEKSGRRWRQQRKRGLRSSARTWKREWCRETARRPTTPPGLSPRPNSIGQQWKRPGGKHNCYKPVGSVLLWLLQIRPPSRVARPPQKRLKAYLCWG